MIASVFSKIDNIQIKSPTSVFLAYKVYHFSMLKMINAPLLAQADAVGLCFINLSQIHHTNIACS